MDTSRLHLHPSFQIGAAWWGVRAALRAGGGGAAAPPGGASPASPHAAPKAETREPIGQSQCRGRGPPRASAESVTRHMVGIFQIRY